MIRILSESDVTRLLPPSEALAAVTHAFMLLGQGGAQNYSRVRQGGDGALLNVMSAVAPTLGWMATKVYPVVRTDVPQSATSTVLMYRLPDGPLEAILEADVLGQRRTGAASALATMLLARPDSETLVVFGAGWQAAGQVAAITDAMASLRRVLIVGRSKARAERFVDWITNVVGIRAELSSDEAALPQADVVVTATGSAKPLFDGSNLPKGLHINAVGSNYANKAELDGSTIWKADRVIVDALDVARLECGDLIVNDFDWTKAIELQDVVTGAVRGRTSESEVTLFESQGLAILDLVCASRVVDAARAASLGVTVELGPIPVDLAGLAAPQAQGGN